MAESLTAQHEGGVVELQRQVNSRDMVEVEQSNLQCLAHVFSPQSGGKRSEDKCQKIRHDGADSGGLEINEFHLLGLVLVRVFEKDICPAEITVTDSTEIIVLVYWEDEGFKTNINSRLNWRFVCQANTSQ